jgi:hypothetical protein
VNRYTLLCMALAALAGHYAGYGPVFALLAAWAWAMVFRDVDLTYGDKTIGQILEERRRRKEGQ